MEVEKSKIVSRPPKPLRYSKDAMLFDVRYSRKPECFEVIYWNPTTRQIEVEYEEPIIDIWFLKKEERTNERQIAEVEMDRCYQFWCKPSQVSAVIAQEIGGEWAEFYEANKDQMSRNDMSKKMCECPWVFVADFDPVVHFRLRWIEEYGTNIDLTKVSEAQLDIECDVIDKPANASDIEDSSNPINAISLILDHVKICVLFVLAPRPKHKLDKKFWDYRDMQVKEYEWLVTHQEEFKEQIRNYDEDNIKYLKDFEIRLHIFDFEDEYKMIKTVYDYINKYRPMFCESWNAKFDHPRLWHRLEYLGYDAKSCIIPKAFKTDQVYYKEDTSGAFQLKNSKDWFYTSTYTVWICQERLFAAIRKSQQERRSYSLSSVGKDMCGIDKLTDTKSGTFRTFAYTDFLNFLLYNVRDTVVQYAIALKTRDAQTLVSRSFKFLTPYPKCFQETHIVRNSREYYYRKFSNIVQACKLLYDTTMDTAFKGAYVAPPEKNAPTGLVLNGKRHNNIIYGSLDADAASYYPSTKMGMNMDPMTLIYKLRIDNAVFKSHEASNRSLNQNYYWYDSKNRPHEEDMTGPLINTFKNGNICSLMHDWFGLPSVTEYFDYLDSMG